MSEDDWIDIAPAAGPDADNVRRANATHPLDFFRGRDFAGNYIFSLASDTGCRDLPDPPRLNGIDVTLERRPPDGARLVLTLRGRDQFDIFRALCNHLLRATADEARGGNASGLRLVLRRLADWHDMLRRRRDDLLSASEVIGLTGELLFLRDEILPRMGAADAVATWRGAHRDEQDFAVGLWQFELKTQLSTADQRLIIASEAQLDTAGSRLLVCHQGIAAGPATATSFTLNSLVASLTTRFADAGPSVLDAFEIALEAWGYVRRDEYDQPAWLLTDRRLFEVRDDFPRITASMLPNGVQNVSYEILLRACEPFAVDLADTINGVFA
ncbi:MAG: PD-(D/E)XK motif protein [Mesorhizobium sp.]|uniref:PD-(D/E)XK motif protein n=1 Tax=Mesorhizobium sp. TaxID=1871066 RepID=UPI000FE56FE1|nr:MAG: PD-(D/E)XK motif protein [Mesorhizobium sp.]